MRSASYNSCTIRLHGGWPRYRCYWLPPAEFSPVYHGSPYEYKHPQLHDDISLSFHRQRACVVFCG